MSQKSISPNAGDRLGVYKRLEEVPDRYRFYQYEDAYAGRDVWDEFVSHKTKTYDTKSYLDRISRAGDSWKEFMEIRQRHPALATPDLVEMWTTAILLGCKTRTAYEHYWVYVEHFYDWLKNHTDHPHVYNPVHMAVIDESNHASKRIWREKTK